MTGLIIALRTIIDSSSVSPQLAGFACGEGIRIEDFPNRSSSNRKLALIAKTGGKIMSAQSRRTDKWKSLLKEKGWLEGNRINLPANVEVYIDFLRCEDRKLAWITEVTDDFVVFEPSDRATQYFLWEDIVGVSVHKR
jgi:hypothetical protein